MTKKKIINEKLEMIEELVRKVYDIISPIPHSYDLKWLMKQCNRRNLFEKQPKCFLTLKKMGREIPFFPICNRSGIIDPRLIDVSMKLIDRLNEDDNVDKDHLMIISEKLKRLKNKFSANVPKPADTAAKKANITKFIRSLSR